MIRFNTLRSRLIFYFSLIITLTLVLSALVATGFVRLYIWETALAELNRQADIIAVQVQRESVPPARLLKIAGRISQTEAFFVKAPFPNSPNPLFDSDQPSRLLQPREFRRDQVRSFPRNLVNWRLLNDGKRQVIQDDLPNSDTPAVFVAQPVFIGGRLAGALILAKPLKFYQQAWAPIVRRLVLAGIITLVVSLILVYYFARHLTEPLKKMTSAAKGIARGEYDKQVDVAARDELGQLAAAFNQMADKVRESFKLRQNFVMNVSHELKTPLTSIQGFTEALMDKTVSEPGEEKAAVRVIHKESKRLERLVNDLLDLAKLDAKQFSLNNEELDFGALLAECRQVYEERAEQVQIDFTADLDSVPAVFTDGHRVQQVIANLLENAFKFTPPGGKVGLKSRTENDWIVIEVSDSGPGIDPEELPNIFRPFYSSKKSQGSGLGLAIASEISKALGGKLIVSSQKGVGTTFAFKLPLKFTKS